MDPFEISFTAADEKHVRREKSKARDLRQSAWWKNRLGQGQCHYCRRQVHPHELTMDHVVPIIRGGRTAKGNVVTACKRCNDQKQYMLPLEWAEYLQEMRRQGRGKD